ncbi:MAG TPA: cytochrome c oxidase assembly protein [Hanamia sp.]|jgi:putative membrane protein|nr:cytochrome c oxidase assembly protein [Hanamia sp.]
MESIFFHWHFDWPTTLFLIALCFIYLYSIGFEIKRQSLYFFAGIFLLILCVDSPLHFLAGSYLFSAHMLSHVLIILIAAPLIVAGIPAENKFKRQLLFFSTKTKNTFIYWVTGVGIMWFWHIPYIFNQQFSGNGMWMMNLEMPSLLIAGIIFSWPVINPCRENRIGPIAGVLYLSTACIFCSLLGLMITFAPLSMYAHYSFDDAYGVGSIIRKNWKISASIDQQIAGLIMWVPGCFIYLTASMILLIKWFSANYSNASYKSSNYTNA